MLLIVRESDSEVLQSLQNQKYEFRLHILHHSNKESTGVSQETKPKSKTTIVTCGSCNSVMGLLTS